MVKINNDHRAAVARAWRDARAHGEDQASFCARQVPPIRPRTLRQWVKTFGATIPDVGPGADLRLVQAALANLHLLANLLERARLDVPGRRDADLGGGAGIGEVSAIITPDLPSGTPATGTPLISSSRGTSFWDEP